MTVVGPVTFPPLTVTVRPAGAVAIVTGATGLVAGGTVAAAEPYETSLYTVPRTTRIEPRPFYGATVTIEAGVRVFRALPPHDRVIILAAVGQVKKVEKMFAVRLEFF